MIPISGAGQQYLRYISCKVGSFTAPEGIEFADFRIVFRTERGDTQTPNSCTVTIYNLAYSTATSLSNGINNGEYTRLLLSAGYQSNYGQIFDGSIKQVRVGREDAKNTYVTITAQDGDEPYNFAYIAQSYAAGTLAPLDDIQNLLQTMAGRSGSSGQPITGGYGTNGEVQLPTQKNIRGRVRFGLTRDQIRQLAQDQNLTWSIQDGQLTLIPATGFIPGSQVTLSPSTGLIGVPEQTQYGIECRCLLNPAIKIGTLANIQGTINPAALGLSKEDIRTTNTALGIGVGKLSGSGSAYYIMQVNHSGDTRGNDWYSDLICMAADATQYGNNVSAAISPPLGPVQAGNLNGSK